MTFVQETLVIDNQLIGDMLVKRFSKAKELSICAYLKKHQPTCTKCFVQVANASAIK